MRSPINDMWQFPLLFRTESGHYWQFRAVILLGIHSYWRVFGHCTYSLDSTNSTFIRSRQESDHAGSRGTEQRTPFIGASVALVSPARRTALADRTDSTAASFPSCQFSFDHSRKSSRSGCTTTSEVAN